MLQTLGIISIALSSMNKRWDYGIEMVVTIRQWCDARC